MAADRPSTYWNHNTAFYGEIARTCSTTSGAVLDVGCGDGLLLARLAEPGRRVIGIEPAPRAAAAARERCRDLPGVTVLESDFLVADLEPSAFGFVSMVAALHHLDTRAALGRAVELLQPGGDLYVLGIARMATRRDLAAAYMSLPRARVVGALRGETWPQDVPVADPAQTLAEIRADAAAVLPGARLRRRAYYRYSLRWSKPVG